MTADPPSLLSVMAAAQALGVSRSTVYRLMDEGSLPYTETGRGRRRGIDPADIAAYRTANPTISRGEADD